MPAAGCASLCKHWAGGDTHDLRPQQENMNEALSAAAPLVTQAHPPAPLAAYPRLNVCLVISASGTTITLISQCPEGEKAEISYVVTDQTKA